MSVSRTLIQLSALGVLTLLADTATAQRSVMPANNSTFPDIQCDASRTRCSLNYDTPSPVRRAATPQAADPTPVAVAPPSGQRYLWQGAGYPACQSFLDMDPQPTLASPYPYIAGNDVPVPLGSTHVSLLGSFQSNLARGPSGNAANIGMLQIRRSGGVWHNVSLSYAYTIIGHNPAQSLFNRATYDGLVNLAELPGGTGIPDMVDVRLAAFPLYTNPSASSDVLINAVCWGTLQVTF
ncbi:hypothetical protein [Denitratimonas sp. CY0512]|uniref:hypothetical protein n=1 Tax=Denitratimonas sp. CY0512 TaxID=3131940 RepID=UPI00309F2ABB